MAGVVRLEVFRCPVCCYYFFMDSVSTVWFLRMKSPVGPLLLAAGEKGLRCLQFDGGKLPRAARGEVWIESRAALRPYSQQLRAYFRGELKEFTCQLDLQGTKFQKECWEALRGIPYGATCSYAELARKVGRPRAFRAVGQANHRNPVAIIVPCHRVIGAGGSLTGYGGGLPIKEKLLRLEGASTQPALSFAAAAPSK
jgi:methylated-DNA-[protein]-cysteine S-methyltransferase